MLQQKPLIKLKSKNNDYTFFMKINLRPSLLFKANILLRIFVIL